MSFFKKFKKALVPSCGKCKLDKQCDSPNLPVTGEGKKGVLIIGEASGGEEDKDGEQWVGETGQKLRKVLKNNKLNLDRDFWKINAVGCRPTKTSDKGKKSNRTPTPKEIEYCRANIEKAIRDHKPKAVWLLGGIAIQSYFGKRQKKLSVTKYRGLKFHDSVNKCWVYATLHPSMLIRNKNDEYVSSTFKRDIRFMASHIGLDRPVYRNPYDYVHVLTEYSDVIATLRKVLKKKPPMFFDYEGTGLKPYVKGHKIASISLAVSDTECYSFPYQYPHWTNSQLKKIKKLWVKILEDHKIEKAVQNLGFEDIWSRNIMGAYMSNAAWDTLNTTHVIDDRHMITGLKWQLFQRYGIEDYEKALEGKLKSKGGSNGFNKVMEIPLTTLLKYGGVDSIGGYWLWQDQKVEVEEKGLKEANDFLHKGSRALTNSQDNGIHADADYYDSKTIELNGKVERIKAKIAKSTEAKLFKKKTGNVLDIGSTDDLKELFFDILDFKPTKLTDNKNPSLAAEALEDIETPLAKKIVRVRKLNKINDYNKLFKREIANGFMHPNIWLNRARTYRSSSSDPNFQNVPKRDKFAKKITRGGILPRPGNRLGGNDYGGVEVCVAACYTEDPTLIDYIYNPENDMHTDSAAKIFKLDKINASKWDIRFTGKNGWVFAQFYGSWYKSCARRIWAEVPKLKLADGTPLIDHMEAKGIGSYAKFEKHLERVERWFWDRFPVFRKWQEKVLAHYLKTGRVEFFTGFARQGQLTPNKVLNTAIQGTAFHCLLKAYIILDEILYEEDWDTDLISQIHDDIISDIVESEVNEYLALQNKVMTKMVPDEYPWIIVPLTTEAELTGVDKPWSTIKEVIPIDCKCGSEWFFKGDKGEDKPHVCISCELKKAA